jgi:hypothetical protein
MQRPGVLLSRTRGVIGARQGLLPSGRDGSEGMRDLHLICVVSSQTRAVSQHLPASGTLKVCSAAASGTVQPLLGRCGKRISDASAESVDQLLRSDMVHAATEFWRRDWEIVFHILLTVQGYRHVVLSDLALLYQITDDDNAMRNTPTAHHEQLLLLGLRLRCSLLDVRVCEQEVIGKIEIVVSTRTLRQDVRDLVASFDHEEINLDTAYMLVLMKASQKDEVVRTREFPRKVISSVTHPSAGPLPSLNMTLRVRPDSERDTTLHWSITGTKA